MKNDFSEKYFKFVLIIIFGFFVIICPLPSSAAPPAAPTLSSPTDFYIKYNSTPHSFSWNSVSGAVQYEIYIDNNSGFGSPEITGFATNTNFSSNTALANGVYYWMVHAKNSANEWGGWSNYRQFVVDTKPPAPSIGGPSNGSSYTQGTAISFSWSPPSGVTNVNRYYLRIVQGTDFNATPYREYELAGTSRNEDTTGWPAGTYTWSVRAIKTAPAGYNQSTYEVTIGWGDYAATRTVTVTTGPFDLMVSVDSVPSDAQQGTNASVTCTVTKTGGSFPSSGYVRVFLYLNQSNSSLDGAKPICDDTCGFDFTTASLEDGQETLSKTVTIPPDVEGPFYILAWVDGPGHWPESDEGHNLAHSGTTIKVWRAGSPMPDEPMGVLARTWDNPNVYWIKYSKKWPILDQATFNGLGYSDAQVQWYGSSALNGFEAGKTILQDNDRFCYRNETDSTVFVLENHQSHAFFNWDGFLAHGFSQNDIYWATGTGYSWIQSNYPVVQAPMIRVSPNTLNY